MLDFKTQIYLSENSIIPPFHKEVDLEFDIEDLLLKRE